MYRKSELQMKTKYTPVPSWKLPNLLNLYNFQYLMNNESRCHQINSTHITVPILIHTARSHFRERQTIRNSWGSLKTYKNRWHIHLVFLLGEPGPDINLQYFEWEQGMINSEQSKFGDIVIGSFIDTYYNLTYKHIMGYKWILNYCPNANFVIKCDDDMFIDIMQWLDWRDADLKKSQENNLTNLPELYCMPFIHTKPQRDNTSKYFVSWEEWPEEYYPDYCSGWAYGISVKAIRKLYTVTSPSTFLWMDDAFTGVLRKLAEKRFNWKPVIEDIDSDVTTDFWTTYRPFCEDLSRDWNEERKFRMVVYVPREELERDMNCMWNKTVYDRNKQIEQSLQLD